METVKNTTEIEETFNLNLTDYEVCSLNDFTNELSNHYYEAHHYTDSIIIAFNAALKEYKGTPQEEKLRHDKDGLILSCSLLQRERDVISTICGKVNDLQETMIIEHSDRKEAQNV